MSTAVDTSAAVPLPAEGDGTPLKKRLRRAERRRNLLFGALILPLALVVPWGYVLRRYVGLPRRRVALAGTG